MPNAIIGLASSGKTTVFNALTRGSAEKGLYGATKSMNIGVGSKPDPRLEHLFHALEPRRMVNAEMTFWDVPTDYVSGALFNSETVNRLQSARALVAVTRDFEDPTVPHPDGSIDWIRDLEKIQFEILFADIALIDRRIERINQNSKALSSAERVDAELTVEVLRGIQNKLEDGAALRSVELDAHQNRAMADTFTLSSLPLIVAVNISEDDAGGEPLELLNEFPNRRLGSTSAGDLAIVPICASLEEELRSLNDADAVKLRREFGLDRDWSQVLMDACLESRRIRTFYTENEREVRAWHYTDGATAPETAGLVHSDMARGFIRAEVVPFEDFKACGSMEEARKRGALRVEGRDYVVADGDIVHFLFSV